MLFTLFGSADDVSNFYSVSVFAASVLAAYAWREGYIQHNPNVPTGRAAFIDFFSKNVAPQPIEPRVKAPLVAILADGDLVVLAFAREAVDPKDSAKKYTTTWF